MTNAKPLRRWRWKRIISEGAVLLTYKSFQHDVQGRAVRCTERSSIWLLTEKAGWQMRFHQGTPTKG